MSDDRTPEQQREAAATRRRWITFGEIVAAIALLISALTLWNSYKERNEVEADRTAEKAERARDKAERSSASQVLLLKSAGGGHILTLSPHDPNQIVQSETIVFPTALGVARIDTLIEPRIEAGWVKEALKQAREARKEAKGPGDARMPVAITTRFTNGTDVELRGLSLVERVGTRTASARLDALWKARNP
jgi:hypothetical protein